MEGSESCKSIESIGEGRTTYPSKKAKPRRFTRTFATILVFCIRVSQNNIEKVRTEGLLIYRFNILFRYSEISFRKFSNYKYSMIHSCSTNCLIFVCNIHNRFQIVDPSIKLQFGNIIINIFICSAVRIRKFLKRTAVVLLNLFL